ncbi:MAG: M23 family metallopeptidase [Anaerolineae bacterium]|nr:M23 family metallopeptidase [Anaerolineae bacterium]
MRWLKGLIWALILVPLFMMVRTAYAQVMDPPQNFHGLRQQITVHAGEELRCFASRVGMRTVDLATTNRILQPVSLPAGTQLSVPDFYYDVHISRQGSTIIAEAVRSKLSEYTLRMLVDTPLYTGGLYALPATGEGRFLNLPCMPRPVVALAPSPAVVVQGQTVFLMLQTSEPVLCEIRYLDQIEPCYAVGETEYIFAIGISALQNPGSIPLHLEITADGYVTAMDVPLTVTDGTYGFQYIRPPAALATLMDELVMRSEEQYLQPYREIRTPFRLWTLPLGYPLSLQLPISADFGDRRSYGGMFDGYHSGVDYRAWSGLPVQAPAGGTVLLSEKLRARGNAVLIDHGWGLTTGYWHLSESNVNVGQLVSRGDIIGWVGNTGLSTGSHLHWETWINGVSVDGKQWYTMQNIHEEVQVLLHNVPSVERR